MLDQLLPPEIPVQELLHELDAAVLEELHVRLQTAIERHRDSPGAREDFRILDRHFVVDGVRCNRREAFDEVQGITMEVSGSVEPAPVVEPCHVDDQRVALPAADRVAHPGVVGRPLDLAQMNGASRVRKREGHLDLVRALDDLKRIGHVHRARNSGQITLQLGVAIDPVFAVLLFDLRGFDCVGNLAVAGDDPDRSGNAAGGAEREHRRGGHPRVGVGINALLRHRTGVRVVCLQIPVGLVQRLPDAAEVWLAIWRSCRP